MSRNRIASAPRWLHDLYPSDPAGLISRVEFADGVFGRLLDE